ncbi:efflux RND transporter periplasmic adaptor subunit [Labrenzia sp. R4_1]|uniref:efflux RND transporter periplasmic adaptor subunit n=1 Tax=Labrenzia sp. R4_1 TaxID=2821106 RepID=UPI001ADD1A6D|nr:efflux RND transporter periplasmic adaptor subunit [Labrenzia sp. R4_1]MBO9425765.1 efflux RND transporter periplasmic adaptor subunit [Labrenzia sp. R4_1]
MRIGIWIALAFMALLAVAGVLSELEDTADVKLTSAPQPLPPVTVVNAEIGTHTGAVTVFAEVAPRWQVDLRSRISGVVSNQTPPALAGSRVSKGEVLLQLEDAPYLANVADARSAYESSKLDLRKARNKHRIAMKDWTAAKPGETPPEMAVHLPQVHVADRALKATEARVAASEYDLRSTTLRAPFDGIVTRRNVSPGATVHEGDVLFQILDDSLLDTQASVSPQEWTLLSKDWSDLTVGVFDERGAKIGTAGVRESGGFLDPQSRKHQLFLEVKPLEEGRILPGAFVELHLPVRPIGNTLRIPESALTQNGFVWHVDRGNRLQRFAAQPLFRDIGDVVVEAPEELAQESGLRIVAFPMSSFLPGRKVAPMDLEQGK